MFVGAWEVIPLVRVDIALTLYGNIYVIYVQLGGNSGSPICGALVLDHEKEPSVSKTLWLFDQECYVTVTISYPAGQSPCPSF
jgi:hypothetical protein